MKGSRAMARPVPEGSVRPVQRTALICVPAAAWGCSGVGETGGMGEKDRDGTAQRTLGQGLWEGNSMLAKRKANTKYLIGIFLLLNSSVRLDFSR